MHGGVRGRRLVTASYSIVQERYHENFVIYCWSCLGFDARYFAFPVFTALAGPVFTFLFTVRYGTSL